MATDYAAVSQAGHAHTVAIDLDGTLLTGVWPDLGDWLPGAVDAMFALHKAGIHIAVWTARTNPIDPWGQAREPGEVFAEIQKVRRKLDDAGLTFVTIHNHMLGKPSATVYVDDRAERYTGRPGSWGKLVPKLLVRCGKAPALFPPTAGGA